MHGPAWVGRDEVVPGAWWSDMAAKHIWDDKEITCRAELEGAKQKKCVFKLFEGATMVKEVHASLSGAFRKQWKGTYKPRACKDDEPSYELSAKVFLDDKPRTAHDADFVVYAHDLTITGTDKATGKTIPGAALELEQKDPESDRSKVTERKTGDDGTLTWRLAYPNDVTVRWKRPWMSPAWDKETARKRKATLEYGFVAKLAFPDPTKPPDPDPRQDPKAEKEHVQYVNMTPAVDEPEHGSKIIIKVIPKEPDKSAEGDSCWLRAEVDAKNNADRKKEPDGYAPGTVVKLQGKLDAKKEVTFDLELGPAGGDKVKVCVGGTAEAEDDEVTIVNWRKLLYDVCAPDTIALEDVKLEDESTGKGFPAAALDWYGKRLAAAFVFFQPRKSSILPATGAPIAACMESAAYMGMSGGDKYVVGKADARPDSWGPADDRVIRMTVCDRAFAGGEGASPHAETFVMETDKDYFGVARAHDQYVFQRNMGWKGGDSIFPGTWVALVSPDDYPGGHPGLDGGVPKSGDCARSWFEKRDFAWLEVQLPPDLAAIAGPLDDAHCPIEVKFKLKTAYEINGNAGGGQQLVVFKPTELAAMACTICHELGHSMGMTIYPSGPYKREPPRGMRYPKVVPEGPYYVGKGHTGSHCAFNLSERDRKRPSYGGKNGTCIMFGEGGDGVPTRDEFCADCRKHLAARRLDDIVGDWGNRKDSAL